MTTETIRAAIVATLNTVPDIGVVHDRERYAGEMNKQRALYVRDGKLNGWFVSRRSQRNEPRGVGNNRRLVATQWELRGYRALYDDESSEIAHDAVIDGIVDAFRADPELGGTVIDQLSDPYDEGTLGPQLALSGPVMFAGVLCHRASLLLVTRHYE